MRNVVLVTIDSLRADHCGFMGYEKDTTPNLDSLAQNGVVFENAIAPGPATPQSMLAIFTGSHSHEHVDSDKFETRESIKWHLERNRTIPERLRNLGYSTAGFTPNPFTSRYYGYDNGFDEFHDFLADDPLAPELQSRIATRWTQNKTVAGSRFLINMLGLGEISMTWESYYEAVQSWVKQATEPYFLWIFLLESHWPYRPPRRYRDHSLWSLYRANWQRAPASNTSPTPKYRDILLDLYDGGIQHADELFERLSSDLPGDPVVIAHADHGEEFGEHGDYGHSQLYEEGIHVPLVIGNVGESRSISAPISLSNIPEYISILAGDNDLSFDYKDEFAIARKSNQQFAVREQRWKYISHQNSELYDLKTDKKEAQNIAGEQSQIAAVFDEFTRHEEELISERRRISNAVSTVLDRREI